MPELPEVECLRLSLLPLMRGRRIVRATLHRADVLEPEGGGAKGRLRGAAARLLEGAADLDLVRHGKQLAVLGRMGKGKPALVIQLGMSGQVFVDRGSAPGGPRDHVHAEWVLDSGDRVRFRDPRRFGGLRSFMDEAALRTHWESLGPDALTIEGRVLAARLKGTRRAIKAALLDQQVLAGVGNIYADESLFLAGLPPTVAGGSLSAEQLDRLAEQIRGVLATSIASGGSTLRDYFNANREAGNYQTKRWVYGRGGEACRVCGSVLSSGEVSQRTTTWCSQCQAIQPVVRRRRRSP